MLQHAIAICGIKHSGKTAAALALEKQLNWKFLDTDDVLMETFESKTGRHVSVRAIYQELGEPEFRKFEAKCVRNIPDSRSGRVLALGGGLLSNPYFTAVDRNMLGFICWLNTPDEVAFERILKDGLPPFLQNEPEPFQAFCKMNEARKIIFRQTSHIVIRPAQTQTPEETAMQIFNLYQERNKNE